MAGAHKNILKSSAATASATMISRILGLVRTVLEAKFIGGGTVMTAWDLAFMVPNLFRRLLGEGALGSALVPLVSHTIEKEGKESARKDLACVFAVLGVILALLCLAIGGLSFFLAGITDVPRVKMAFRILPLVIPYAFFICLVGAIGSVLNSLRIFFLPAIGACFMNIAMIAALLFFVPVYGGDADAVLRCLGLSVLISGAVQLALMVFLLHYYGMMPDFKRFSGKDFRVLKELWKLTLPAIVGASALQISLLVDRSLACYLSEYAEPALKYSDRIIYFPIGVFAVSIGAVCLADMSRKAGKNNLDELISVMIFSLRHLLFICVPIAVFILFFREPIIRLMYFHGKFGQRALEETSWAMLFYSLGIPSFAAIKIVTAGFYARKDMKTPLKVSVFCILLNIVLNLILMWPMKQGGIALATVIASLMNNCILFYLLSRRLRNVPFAGILKVTFTSLVSSLLGAAAALMIYHKSFFLPKIAWLPQNTVPFMIGGLVFGIVYIGVSVLLRSGEPKEILGMFFKKRFN